MTLSRSERFFLACLLAILTWFTWRGLTMHYSGDDMMNMYGAWQLNPSRLCKSVILFWVPIYRPVGSLVYRAFYEFVGFHPAPLNIFCWLLLAGNMVLAYGFFRTLLQHVPAAFAALGLTLVHPLFQDLYLSSGTMYDRFWFLFTTLGLTLYAQWRSSEKGLTVFRQILLGLLCILSMSSKESGVALPVLMGLYELIFYIGKERPLGAWFRTRGPVFAVLAVITLIDIRRVNRTPEIAMTPQYHASASLGLWLERVAAYFSILTVNHIAFTALAAAGVLLAMAALGLVLRNRAMLFGLAFFVVTLTPAALISMRPGYVLYVPEVGLALWAGAVFLVVTQALPRFRPVLTGVVVLAALAFFARNWPAPFDPKFAPEFRLTEQFERDYPKLPKGSRLLFVTDDFPQTGWDLLFNLRLMYHDSSLTVHRLAAPKDQGPPDPNALGEYDHVFTLAAGKYRELDRSDIARSVRENIFADMTLGRFMSIARKDHAAYIISGVMDGDNPDPSRWTAPSSRYRFDLYPAASEFHAKFWVPDFVSKTGARQLTVLVNDHAIGAFPLNHDGMNEIRFPVPASVLSRSGYTQVELKVDNPWKDAAGNAFGVIILNAGFDYATIK